MANQSNDVSSQVIWLQAYLERCLARFLAVDRVTVDGDGDVSFRAGTAQVWVGVCESEPLMVSVFAHAAVDVKPTVALYREINDLNMRALSAKVMLNERALVVRQTLLATAADETAIEQAVQQVCQVANDIGHLAAVMFDGGTPFEPEPARRDSRESDV